ncbi:MAG: hypothetical protein HQM10_02680 [Candidatus Riflebacteria bacterium]|nr:hypothetical protein [Candidatus Riflebacteria bacterium]
MKHPLGAFLLFTLLCHFQSGCCCASGQKIRNILPANHKSSASASYAKHSFLELPFQENLGEVYDLRDLLLRMSKEWNISLILGREVRGGFDISPEERKQLKNNKMRVREFLDLLYSTKKLSWTVWKNVLFVGSPIGIKSCIDSLKKPVEVFQNTRKNLDAEYYHTSLQSLVKQLSDCSDVKISVADDVHEYITMRISSIPWDQVLIGLVSLNGLQMIVSDFSVLITP